MLMNERVWGHRDLHPHGQPWSPQPWIQIKHFVDADCRNRAAALQLHQNNMHTCLQTHRHDAEISCTYTLVSQHYKHITLSLMKVNFISQKISLGSSPSCQTIIFGWANTQTCMHIIHMHTHTSTYCVFACICEWLNAGELRPCFHRLQPVSVWSAAKVPAGFEDGGLPLLGQPLKPHAR